MRETTKRTYSIFFSIALAGFAPSIKGAEGYMAKGIASSLAIENDRGAENVFSMFSINVAEGGDYYMEFWLLPARHADGSYTHYVVSVNEDEAATVSPKKGNWQNVRLDGNKRVHLKKGRNIIKVTTSTSEFPQVESIKVSPRDSDDLFSPDAYEDYISELREGRLSNPSDVSEAETVSFELASSYDDMITSVPLRYSFSSICSFTKGQDVLITSTSGIPHDIDMIYFGNQGLQQIGSLSDETSAELTDISIGGPGTKPTLIYTPASTDEMQGLNWRGPSEEVLESEGYEARIRTIIPQTGLYMIRLRSESNDMSSTANVEVNNSYYYDGVPVSYSGVDNVFSADGNKYACMTRSVNSTADAMIFVHSVLGRVVGFNDDTSSSIRSLYHLKPLDAYLAQPYKVKTSKISVSSYSSQSPNTNCSILLKNLDSDSSLSERSRRGGHGDIQNTSAYNSESAFITLDGDRISVVAESEIESIAAYDMTGTKIAHREVKEKSISLTFKELNAASGSFIVLQVTMEEGQISKNVLIP